MIFQSQEAILKGWKPSKELIDKVMKRDTPKETPPEDPDTPMIFQG